METFAIIPTSLTETTKYCLLRLFNDSVDLSYFVEGEHKNAYFSNGQRVTDVLSKLKDQRKEHTIPVSLEDINNTFNEIRDFCSKNYGRTTGDRLQQMAEINRSVQERMDSIKPKYAGKSFEQIVQEVEEMSDFEPEL